MTTQADHIVWLDSNRENRVHDGSIVKGKLSKPKNIRLAQLDTTIILRVCHEAALPDPSGVSLDSWLYEWTQEFRAAKRADDLSASGGTSHPLASTPETHPLAAAVPPIPDAPAVLVGAT